MSARAAAAELNVREVATPSGAPVNDWIADMMSIYRMITGNEPLHSRAR
jgi:hypothetical protein